MMDDHIKKCPKCGGKVKRLLGSGAGIIFKGSGFYETDYRKNDYKNAVQKEKTAASSPKKTEKDKKSGKDAVKNTKSEKKASSKTTKKSE